MGIGALSLHYWTLYIYIRFETDIARDLVSTNDDQRKYSRSLVACIELNNIECCCS